jgi:iron complex transport system ATP-binding protein
MSMPSSTRGLVIHGLVVERGGRTVVHPLDLAAAPGQVIALIGPNGAGKSSALQGILGLLPRGGSVRLDDMDLATLEPPARARLVGYVPQRSRLVSPMSVENVVALGRFAHQGMLARLSPTDATAVDEALIRTDTARLRDRAFTHLSAGEQQRVLLARALVGGARTVCLDEPTAALDVGHALALLQLLRRLAGEGHLVLVVLHDLDQVQRVADRVLLLHEGRLIADGTPAEVLSSEHLAPVFCVEPVPGGALGFRPAGAATYHS